MTDAPGVIDRHVRRARLGGCRREARLQALALERLDDPAPRMTTRDPGRHDAAPSRCATRAALTPLPPGKAATRVGRRTSSIDERGARCAVRSMAGLGVMQSNRGAGGPPAGPASAMATWRVLFELQPTMDGSDVPSSATDSRGVTVRYVIVAFGGLLGMGKSRVAIPAVLADTKHWTVTVGIHVEDIRRAPRFSGTQPLSRQDEVTICHWFDVPLYWQASGSSEG